jgi:CRISPR-associated endonuclease/helicase Cas3
MIVDPIAAALLARHWGKADPSAASGTATHHTVLGHSLDVAACGFVLVEQHAVLRDQFSRTMALDAKRTPATIAAICSLHDIGKFDVRFARKAPTVADQLRPDTAGISVARYDHGTEGFRQLEQDEAAHQHLVDQVGPAAVPLLRAVTGHHGNLPTCDLPDPSRAMLPRRLVREDISARRSFLELACSFFKSLGAELPWPAEVDGTVVQRVAGITAIADWVGSDVAFFPYRPGPILDLAAYWRESCDRASRACRAAGLLRAVSSDVPFGRLFPGYTPRDVQTLTEQVSGEEPALVIVEAEMGKGKTEAALSLAARFLTHHQAEGITVALPTMATSNAMFSRIEDVTHRLYPTDEVQLALAHSRASRNPFFNALVQRGLSARDRDASEASVACARWLLNKKRVLLAQVGVGTIDQALQAALTVKHQFVRLFGLSRNVVIIDEVHAYDAYMEVLLEHLLSWLGALRVPVILLSATLPSQRRAALAAAWQGVEDSSIAADDGDQAPLRSYPLVSVTTTTSTFTIDGATKTPSRIVQLEQVCRSDDDDYLRDVARRMIDGARRGARIAWIRNTVSEAQRAYKALLELDPDVEHVLFHARFRGVDRTRIEAQVLDRFGKSAPVGGRVLIATQVVEQSLDLDFDELHSDLAPIDLLFQRTGRLHRHVRDRVDGFTRPVLHVHAPSEVDDDALKYGPSRYVYDVATLWLANQAIRSRSVLTLPEDIRPLVEQTYHPTLRNAKLRTGPGRLLEYEVKLIDELEGKRTKARRCCIPPTSADADGSSVMDDDDEAVRAFTRDGSSTTVLPMFWKDGLARTLSSSDDGATWNLDASDSGAWRLVSELMDQTMSVVQRFEPTAPGDPATWNAFQRRFHSFAAETGLGKHIVLLPLQRHGAEFVGRARRGDRTHSIHYSFNLGLRVLRLEDAAA